MRVLASAALILLLSAGSAFAQRGSRGGFSGGGFRGSFGGARIRTPIGGFHRGIVKPGFRIGIGHNFARNKLFFGHSNRFFFNKGFGFHRGFGFNRGFGFGGYFIPYSYVLPAYPNDYYYSPYSLGYSGVSPYSLGYPAAAAVTPPAAYTPPASPVVINQQFTSPVIRESSPLVYEPPARQPPASQPPPEDRSAAIYLIAMKDSNVIRPVLAYWVDNGTLHYVGLDRKQVRVPLGEVDRDLSRQLNRERGVPFHLPATP